MEPQTRIDFYSNNANIVSSYYDFTLQFTAQTPIRAEIAGKSTPIEVAGTCNVRMSPQHAKALATLLVQHIAEYEAQTGRELALPERLQEIWDRYIQKEGENDVDH